MDISPAKDKGIIKEIKREGKANCRAYKGDRVTVHYTGTLEDGTMFDTSRERVR